MDATREVKAEAERPVDDPITQAGDGMGKPRMAKGQKNGPRRIKRLRGGSRALSDAIRPRLRE